MTNELSKILLKIPGLEIDKRPEGFLEKSCTTAEGRLSGKKVAVRLFGTKALANYLKEKEVLETLDEAGLSKQPKIIRADNEYAVLVLSYLEGVSAGDSFNFSVQFINQIEPKALIGCLTDIKKIKPTIGQEKKKLLQFYEQKYQGMVTGLVFKNNEIIQNWYKYFKNEARKDIAINGVLTHGDVNPTNIIYSSNKIVGLIDWDLSQYDAYMRDFSYQYYSAMNFPEWQNKYLTELNFNKKKIKDFYFYVLFSLLGDIVTWDKMIKNHENHHYRSGYLSSKKISFLIKRNKSEIDRIVKMKLF